MAFEIYTALRRSFFILEDDSHLLTVYAVRELSQGEALAVSATPAYRELQELSVLLEKADPAEALSVENRLRSERAQRDVINEHLLASVTWAVPSDQEALARIVKSKDEHSLGIMFDACNPQRIARGPLEGLSLAVRDRMSAVVNLWQRQATHEEVLKNS